MAPSIQRPWKKMSPEVLRFARMWLDEDGLAPSEIAELLHQDKSTLTRLTRLLVLKVERGQEGRPKAFTEEQVDRLVKILDAMILEANQEHRIIVEDLDKRLHVTSSNRTMLNVLRARDICFRANRTNPISPSRTSKTLRGHWCSRA